MNVTPSKLLKHLWWFSDDRYQIFCHLARNPDDVNELQEGINKLVEWANNWQINLIENLSDTDRKQPHSR